LVNDSCVKEFICCDVQTNFVNLCYEFVR
jgi:hypothetical protein